MLIFILPSSLYLKITSQDGDKGTQRIWAALFLGLGVLFSLVSIPLVIYDWACSSSSDEGRWDQLRKGNSQITAHPQPLITSLASLQKQTEIYKIQNRLTRWYRNRDLFLKWFMSLQDLESILRIVDFLFPNFMPSYFPVLFTVGYFSLYVFCDFIVS